VNSHTSTEYDDLMARAHKLVVQMGERVRHQVDDAVESLGSGSPALINQILRHEAVVNSLERSIDELAGQIIARRQPAAGDLRYVLAIVGTTTDLERIGDEAKKIALQARKIFSDGRPAQPRTVEVLRMAAIVQDMLRAAIAALETLEPRAAIALARRDEESDLVFQGVLRQLISFMIEDPRTITACLDFLFVAKSLERIGDHARNVSEHVVYATIGKDVRHATPQELEEELRAAG
jgi:phosphate transport system protein